MSEGAAPRWGDMAVETVLLALLGVVALWLAFDAGLERHRLNARAARSTDRAARRAARSVAGAPSVRMVRGGTAGGTVGGLGPGADAWRYWPLTLPAADDGSPAPRP